MPIRNWTAIAFAFLAGLANPGAGVAQPAPRQFAVPGYGSLGLRVPADWRVAEQASGNRPSVDIVMRPAAGERFNLQITSIGVDPAKLGEMTQGVLRERVQGVAKKLLPQSVEGKADVVELRSKDTRGYYFSLTDRASSNTGDDYKYVTQGMAITGGLLTTFTFLHRDAGIPQRDEALRMLAEGSFTKDASEAAPVRRDALTITESPQAYVLAVPVSRLTMVVPKGEMRFTSVGEVAGSGHPRYFNFAGTINVSGWFEPSQGYKGMQDFWKSETTAWSKRGLPPPLETTFVKIGGWDAVVYDIALPSGMKGANSHIRAHWVQAGTWIDLHVSIASQGTSAENRARLTQFIQTIQVSEKDK